MSVKKKEKARRRLDDLLGALAWRRYSTRRVKLSYFNALLEWVLNFAYTKTGDPWEAYQYVKRVFSDSAQEIYDVYLEKLQFYARTPEAVVRGFHLGVKLFLQNQGFTNYSMERNENKRSFHAEWWMEGDCPFCRGVKPPSKEMLCCPVPSGILEWIEIARQDEWGASEIRIDEVECIRRGDPRCKWVWNMRDVKCFELLKLKGR